MERFRKTLPKIVDTPRRLADQTIGSDQLSVTSSRVCPVFASADFHAGAGTGAWYQNQIKDLSSLQVDWAI